MAVPYNMPPAVYGAVQAICLAFPEAVEKETWGHPTFRIRDKMFASCGAGEDDDGKMRVTIVMKAEPGEQASLLAEGYPFFYPKYVGGKGWIGIQLNVNTDWDELGELIEESYRVIAPKTLVKQLDAER